MTSSLVQRRGLFGKRSAQSSSRQGKQRRRLQLEALERRDLFTAGILDNTFGVNGLAALDVPGGFIFEQGRSVALQADGKIVVGGFDSNIPFGESATDGDMIAARFNADGSLDPTFGPGGADGDGRVTVDFGMGGDGVFSLAIQADGKIVLGGYASNGTNVDFALARLNPDGSLDTTFGTGGMVTTDFGFSSDIIQGIVIQPDGKIVAGGPAARFSAEYAVSPKHTLEDIGTLGGPSAEAYDINASGQVVGVSPLATGQGRHAFRTGPGAPSINSFSDDLGTLGGASSFARGINDLGQAVGFSQFDPTNPDRGLVHAFRTFPNAAINAATDDLGTLGGSTSTAFAINNSGQVVGHSAIAGDVIEHAFRTAPNAPINPATDDLGSLGGALTEAHDINEAGAVVGFSFLPGDVVRHGYITAPNGVITAGSDIGTLGGDNSAANGISEAGWVVGSSEITPGSQAAHAFRLPPGATTLTAAADIGTLPGTLFGVANAVNEAGWVVGFSGNDRFGDDPNRHAWVYNGTTMFDLNDIVPPPLPGAPRLIVREALSINDVHDIVGLALPEGGDPRNDLRAVKLRPTLLDFGVVRYEIDGDLDPTFGTGGQTVVDFTGRDDTIRNITLQPDGKVLATGLASNADGTTDFGLIRLTTSGALDPTFGTGGRVNTDFGDNQDDGANVVIVQPDGKILAAGPAIVPGPTPATSFADWGLARYNTNGTLDISFDGDGLVRTDFAAANDVAYGAGFQQDGKIVVIGLAGVPSMGFLDGDIGVARYNSDGALDPTFGTGGRTTTDIGGSSLNEAFDMVFDGTGDIIVTGFAPFGPHTGPFDDDNNIILARYDGNPIRPDLAGITEFALPAPTSRLADNIPNSHPAAITVADGDIWLTDPFGILPPGSMATPLSGRLAVFDMETETFTEFDLPIPPHSGGLPTTPHALTQGPDGNIWFSAFTPPIPGLPVFPAAIGAFNPVTRQFINWFPLPPDTYPHIPITGPEPGSRFVYVPLMGTPFDRDPNVPGTLARINVDTGVIEQFPNALPPAMQIGNNMHSLTTGPDGNLWVAFRGSDQVARFNVTTLVFDIFVQFPVNSGPNDVKYSAFDGRFYVALQDSKEIGTFTFDAATDMTGPPTTFPAFISPADDVVVGNVIIGPEGRSIWYPGTLEFPLTDADMNGVPDVAPQERINRYDLVTGQISEFEAGIVPSRDPIEVIVGPDNNLWYSATNPGWLNPPAINPNPGKLGRLVPSEAEAFANGAGTIEGNIYWSRLLQKQFGAPGTPPVPDVDIFYMKPDGSGQTNVFDFPGNDVWPTLSPDGTKIAFTSIRDGNAEIYVIELSIVVDPLTAENGFDPFRARLVTTTTRLTNDPGNDAEPAWSPDGSRILFTSDRTGNYELFVMNADGTGQVNLTNNPAADTEGDWSPDGSRIAFGSNRDGNGEIYVMNADGSGVVRLTFDPGTDLSPAWSPNGSKIVFTGVPSPGQDEIIVMNADGSGRRRMTTNQTGDFLPDWQPLSRAPGLPLPAKFDLAFVAPTGAPPVVGIGNAQTVEGGGPMVFPVMLDMPSSTQVVVSYLTNAAPPDQAAPFSVATPDQDYVSRSGLLVFQPGEVIKTIIVPAIPDGLAEPNEVFANILFLPLGAQIAEHIPTTTKPFGEPGFGKITNQALPSQPPATITEFTLPQGFGHPGGIVIAPDGAIWSTEQFDNKLLRFDITTQTAREVVLPAIEAKPGSLFADEPPGVYPHFIMIADEDHDGRIDDETALWFTGLNDVLGRIDLTTEQVTLFRDGISPNSSPHFLLQGPDGNLYFTEQVEEVFPEPGGQNKSQTGLSRIARFDLATQQLTEITPIGLEVGDRVHGMAVDADDNLWLALEGRDQLALLDLQTLTLVDFIGFSKDSGPHDVSLGPDGNLYAVLQDVNRLARVNPRTRTVQEFVVPGLSRADGPSLVFLGVGPDQTSLYFSEFVNDRIGKFDMLTGEVTEYFQGITPGTAPIGIITAGDGNVWFSEPVLDLTIPGKMGRLEVDIDPNHPFVATAYRDLLGREVDTFGLEFWLGVLNGGATRTEVSQMITESQEYRIKQVTTFYEDYLGRSPDQSGLTFWLNSLAQGSTMDEVQAGIIGSTEYFQLNGATNDSFLDALYRDVLGRAIDAQGQQGFSDSLAQGVSREDVAKVVFGSTEADQVLVMESYQEFLGREAEADGLAFWTSSLQTGMRDEAFIAGLVGSDEYLETLGGRVGAAP